jgi:predicted esterase
VAHDGRALTFSGTPLSEASAAVLMLHGRGDSARGILSLADVLETAGVAYAAPEADGNTWYPHSFLTPLERNEPQLSSALKAVQDALSELEAAGIARENIVLLGFSQGACLALESAARNATCYGGVIALSGGLIGPDGAPRDYDGSLSGTPVFLGCSDVDAHIPEARVRESAEVMERLGGAVDLRIYPGMGHTVNQDEIDAAGEIVAAARRG